VIPTYAEWQVPQPHGYARDRELTTLLLLLARLEPAFCQSADALRVSWQLRTSAGVRLIELRRDDLSTPRLMVLRAALEDFWLERGFSVSSELEPAGSGVFATVFLIERASVNRRERARFKHTEVALGLLFLTLVVLESERV